MRFIIFPIFILFLAMAGCATPEAPWQSPRPLGADITPYRPHQPAADDRAPTAEGELSLRQALELSLQHNPNLKATAWDVKTAQAEQRQVALWTNPEIELEVENFDEPETTLRLSQLVELGWKRSQRVKQGRYDTELAAWEYEARRIAVLSNVTRRFIRLLVAQEQLDLAQSLDDIAEQVHQSVQDRVDAGRVSPIELTKSDIEQATAQIERQRAQQELAAARTDLAAMWGESNPGFERGVGDLDQLKPLPPYSDLEPLITQNPELARWQAEIGRHQTARTLAKRALVPDLRIGGGVKRSDELADDIYIAGVALEVPLFNRNQGERQAATYRLHRAEAARQAVETQLRTELQNHYRAFQQADAEVRSYRETLLPAAQTAFEAIREGYELGEFSLMDLLDAQRTLAEVQTGRLMALQNYHLALIDVEHLIGQSLP